MRHAFFAVLLGMVACRSLPAASPTQDATAETDSSWRATRPRPGPSPDLKLPVFQRTVLPNGLTVLLAERRDLPLVSFAIAVAAGSAAEPAHQGGLAEFAYGMLLEGTRTRSTVELAAAFADLGATPTVSTEVDGALVETQVLSRHADAALVLLADVVTKPRLAPSDFRRRRTERAAELSARLAEPRFAIAPAFLSSVFGGAHPYGHPTSGSAASIQRLELRDVQRFLKRHLGPKNAALVVSGDANLEQARAWALHHFGQWRGPGERAPRPKAVTAKKRARMFFVSRPGLDQTLLWVGRTAIAAGDAREPALELATAAFGGVFGSRLNLNLREAHGYTYGANAVIDPRYSTGPLFALTQVRADATGAALKEFFAEIGLMSERPLTEDELLAARGALVQSLPGSFDTLSSTTAALASLFWEGRPMDAFAKMADAIERTSLADVQAAARDFFDPATMQLGIVGDPAVVREQVPPLALGPLVDVTPKDAARR
ncbi:MAG: M16 family metallopeptidase [Myxococcaceae bacterium]